MRQTKNHLQRRCPRLGGDVTFSYCRTVGESDLPCWKVFDCWWEIFDVVAYLKCRLDPGDFERIANTRPKHKITSLLELVEAAKNRVQEEHSEKQ